MKEKTDIRKQKLSSLLDREDRQDGEEDKQLKSGESQPIMMIIFQDSKKTVQKEIIKIIIPDNQEKENETNTYKR